MDLRLLIFAVPVVLGVAGLAFLLATGRTIGLDEEDPRDDDPVLARLRERNPGLHVARGALERARRIPVYWIGDPARGERILLPRSLVDDEGSAVIRLAPCDPFAIPARLRYPRATAPACLVIDRDRERLHAFFFRTEDSLHDVVMHYDGKVGRIGSYAEASRREALQPDGSIAFSHAYWLYERPPPHHQVFALVAYRRERLAGGDGAP